MTVYAAGNLVWVSVSAEGHGGCGQPHSRPVENGAPAKLWALDCPPCENYLRSDPQWSATLSEIPETYDEKLVREDFEKRGAKDKDAILTLAIASLAGFTPDQLPETLTRMISGVRPHIPAQMECPQGHGQPAGRKFCAECGSPMHGTAAAAAIAPVQKAAKPQSGPKRPQRIRDQNKGTLAALCRAHGLPEDGTHSDLVNRLSGKGVTNNDLARFLEAREAVAA